MKRRISVDRLQQRRCGSAGALPAQAPAEVPHTVQPGETLWSIAASNNFTTRALAAANGLPEDAQVVTGTTIQIPSEAEAAAALGAAAAPRAGAPAPRRHRRPRRTRRACSAPTPCRPVTRCPTSRRHNGVSVGQLAWMNGLDPAQPLLVGTALKLPTAAPQAVAAPATAPDPQVVPDAAPHPVPVTVTAPQIGEVASSHGVSPALAAAVAWQESGFQNGVVSSANARGVMQILPGTWSWIQQQLAGRPLDPDSAVDNVHAGVMYLRQLIADSGGDEAGALASYYQGAASVRQLGLLPDTQRYVANVTALKARFGG